ncbi:lipase atg15 [Physcia stellaris]|nr:lipase atg15 [Physcia stellaris]
MMELETGELSKSEAYQAVLAIFRTRVRVTESAAAPRASSNQSTTPSPFTSRSGFQKSTPFKLYGIPVPHIQNEAAATNSAKLFLGGAESTPSTPAPAPAEHDFTLRHLFHHGAYLHPKLHRRLDVRPQDSIWMLDDDKLDKNPQRSFHLRSWGETIQRLADRRFEVVDALMSSARLSGYTTKTEASAWTMDEVSAPNITDKDTVLSLANMAANAYIEVPGTGNWEDVDAGFNVTDDFGWQNDGLRGHIFADEGNKTIVIALKGTTPATKKTTISSSVAVAAKADITFGAKFAIALPRRIPAIRPASSRHYMGSIAITKLLKNFMETLLGLTYGIPVTTFEAVPEALPAMRLGLPAPPGTPPGAHQARKYTGAYHFGHTADPIFVGTCNALTSACKVCIYDTVKDKSWRVSATTHSVRSVIDDVIKVYDEVPECVPDSTEEEPCVDCFNWKYFKSNGSEGSRPSSSSSSSTSVSLTRTTTCHTPGWWGCLDESTTTSSTSALTTQTITTATTTCLQWGWFGSCLDPVTTNTTITTTIPITSTTATLLTTETIVSPTTTCLKWGWFWCLDPVETETTSYTTIPLTTITVPVTALTATTTSAMPERAVQREIAAATASATGLLAD